MTDRFLGCTVVFENRFREDDAKESVLQAIQQIKGVQSVHPVISTGADFIAKQNENYNIVDKLLTFIRSDFGRKVK